MVTEQDRKYQEAKRKVEKIKGFYVHLLVYVLVNAMLIAINLITSPNSIWFVYPLMGWGIGVAMHGVSVFGIGKLFDSKWEERKIKEFMEKDEI
ncbi:2TM domain-containing protein [Effusibacillus lacus]|uniref:Histidine kinase n=1 Tax=Effusibacillus lacus TaxID=1348429 RepID=A0A292YRB0_9BACL|nr:2TM domain-containing protein [Effusibacillus lacus]TCS68985.1 2TM domain-containing protein [Effusibacillus lacus]GAX91451.1 histidine kinase [Effusibacillus lacus]